MELQLGLAPPSNKSVFGLDLNNHVYELPKEAVGSGELNHRCQSMRLQLGSQSCFSKTSSNSTTSDDSCTSSSNAANNKKRSFCAAAYLDETTRDSKPETLPLLLWNNQPNDEDDDDPHNKNPDHNNFFYVFNNKIEEDGDDGMRVGWPPIKYRRTKVRRGGGGGMENVRRVDNGCFDCHGRQSNYVKVKMDGAAIARKINLSQYDSFQSLKAALLLMFGICPENSRSYNLTYQDTEGDWLLAADVSWRSFNRSVHRLKLMRNNNG